MALSKDKKNEVVSEVADLLKDSKLTVVAKYQGTSVKSMQALRRSARENGTRVMVVKNRLFKKALESDDRFKQVDDDLLSGQLIYAFNPSDEVAPAQSLANFAKTEPQIEFVGGLMADGKLLSADEVKTLASLPSKEQLVAQVIATLLSPASSVVSSLTGDLPAIIDALAAKAA